MNFYRLFQKNNHVIRIFNVNYVMKFKNQELVFSIFKQDEGKALLVQSWFIKA
jgi:hypothetical protein